MVGSIFRKLRNNPTQIEKNLEPFIMCSTITVYCTLKKFQFKICFDFKLTFMKFNELNCLQISTELVILGKQIPWSIC